MVQFKKLRLNGFKSFVDRIEIDIGQGLTGIVGPNGCGKSNLTEALRWVMGENSPKRMRGDGMEDVIFNGTSARSSRNFAEVTVVLDNATKTAPSPYNHLDEIEVVRRIERDHGSTYRINGKVVRARDTQMLFADIVVGANSPALVSQGRVTEMINAKPLERRKILEESAGVTGLYARRHEAELRLRAASTNLVRIQDSIGGLEIQYNSLKRQARQAARYKNLNEDIKKLQKVLSAIEWLQAQQAHASAQSVLQNAEKFVAEKLSVITQLNKTLDTQSESLPELRTEAAKAATVWQNQSITIQRLEEEEELIRNTLEDLKKQIVSLIEDQRHEDQNLVENSTLIGKLEGEEKSLRKSSDNESERISKLQEELFTQKKLVDRLDQTYQASMQTYAQTKAKVDNAETTIKNLREELENLGSQKQTVLDEQKELEGQTKEASSLENLEKDLSKTQINLRDVKNKDNALSEDLEKQRTQLQSLREEKSQIRETVSALQTEIKTLETVLSFSGDGDTGEPLLTALKADKGYESALSRALGEALMASIEAEGLKYWGQSSVKVSDLPSLPKGIQSLAARAKGPEKLSPALHMVGVAETKDQAQDALKSLKPGQSLVTAQGDYWRWDGYHIASEAPDVQSSILKQKNRYEDILKDLPKEEAKAKKIEDKLTELQKNYESSQTQKEKYRDKISELDTLLENLQTEIKTEQEVQSETLETRVRLREQLNQIEKRTAEITNRISSEEESLVISREALEKTADTESLQESKAELEEAHSEYHRLKSELDRIENESKRRQMRLHAITDERLNLQNRVIRAKDQLEKFKIRQGEAESKLESLKERPQEIKTEKENILDGIGALEKRKSELEDKLASAETETNETKQAIRERESEYQDAREARGRAVATVESTEQNVKRASASIEEQYEMSAKDFIEDCSSDLVAYRATEEGIIKSGSYDEIRTRRDKLMRDREAIGPVNLRAEVEADEIEKQLGNILSEQNDLSQAIEELDTAIQKLNNEARVRLNKAFHVIDGYFKNLFRRLFDGGQAHLKLIESDDVLEAGLEIYAQPPGKTLQSLSLLSGGEQTLTSIALIFAMFLTTPSPICVLDEIDAPLDDANVDRVCGLLEEMSANGNTRFLIITHHRLTMARMDRLYGVTMGEHGVSQLVSVDLQQKLDFLNAAE